MSYKIYCEHNYLTVVPTQNKNKKYSQGSKYSISERNFTLCNLKNIYLWLD